MKLLILIACLLATPAFAADSPDISTELAHKSVAAPVPAAPPPVLPFLLTPEEYTTLVTYLNAQPAGIANPILNFLVGKEQAAQAAGKKP